MRSALLFAAVATVVMSAPQAMAKPVDGLWFKAVNADEDRPLIVSAQGTPNGAHYGLVVTFDKAPADATCGGDCANATLFLDTDNKRETGLKVGKGALENGADLSVSIQGAQSPENGAPILKVKVRLLIDATADAPAGEKLFELDSKTDPDELQLEGAKVYVSLDVTDIRIPRADKLRLVYHPPGAKAVEGTTPGLSSKSKGAIHITTKKRVSH